MTAAYIERILETTIVGTVEIKTTDGQQIEIDPEVMEWEVMEKERSIHCARPYLDDAWINIDHITTIRRTRQ